MGENIRFDYYYGQEAEQFSFYRIPRLLITDPRFQDISNDSKLLYGLMLDRMSLSMKNGWIDEENRVFIVYTIQSIMEDLNISKGTAVKVMAELDAEKGIGLIERKHRGLGKPDVIYVKNFAAKPHSSTEVQNLNLRESKNCTPGSQKNTPQEVQNVNLSRSDNCTHGVSENKPLEEQDLNPNKTENKKTKESQSDHIRIFEERMAMVRENIDYDWYVENKDAPDRKMFFELYNIIESVMADGSDQIRIGDHLLYAEVVKSRMLKLNQMHLRYVMDCVGDQTGEIRRMDRYLLAALYHAPETEGMYYTQKVHHDFYGGSE